MRIASVTASSLMPTHQKAMLGDGQASTFHSLIPMIEPLHTFGDPQHVEAHYKERQAEIAVYPAIKGDFHYKKRTVTGEGVCVRTSEMLSPWSMVSRNESNVF